MMKIIATAKRSLLEIPLRRPALDRIARSGEAGAAVNCYVTRVMRTAGDPLIVESAHGDTLDCLAYDGDRYSIQTQVQFADVLGEPFEFTHYHGWYTITYYGFFQLAVGRIFRIPYIRAALHRAYDRFAQSWFNRRKLVTKQRIDLLKIVLSAQLSGRDKVSSLSVMSLIHTDRWYLHPKHESEHHRVQFYLEKLAETKDLAKNGIDYQITGQGVAAIELYEEQERKHSESILAQRRMLWLTVVILLLTVVQAGLVRLPPLLDFTRSEHAA
jgi:hypothetical protein